MNFAKKKYSQKKKLLPVQLPLPLPCRTKCIKRHIDGTLVSSSLGSSLFQIQWKIVNSGYSIIDLSEIFISTFSSSFRNDLYISWKKIKRAIFLLFVTFHYDLSFFFFFEKKRYEKRETLPQPIIRHSLNLILSPVKVFTTNRYR